MADSGRGLKVADFVRDELAAIIQREMRDPRVGMVSVNEVRVSRDLSYADAYVSSLEAQTAGEREALIEVLNRAAGFFRSELAKRHRMRTTPRVRFHYDELVVEGPRLDALIDRAVEADRDLSERSPDSWERSPDREVWERSPDREVWERSPDRDSSEPSPDRDPGDEEPDTHG